jgi:hypothetical protein
MLPRASSQPPARQPLREILPLLVLCCLLAAAAADLRAEQPVFPDARMALEAPLLAISQANTCYLIDVTSAAMPRMSGQARLPGRILSLAMRRPALFVGLQTGTIMMLNVEDPRRPVTSGTMELKGPVTSLAIRSQEMLAAGQEVALVDLHTTPPTIMSRTPLSGGMMVFAQNFGYQLSNGLEGPFVRYFSWAGQPRLDERKLAYPWVRLAFCGTRAAVAGKADLALVDLKNPLEPELLAPVAGVGEYRDLLLTSDTLLAVGTAGLDIYDVREPRQPELLGSLAFNATVVQVSMLDEIIYALDELGYLHVVDAQNPHEPLQTVAIPLGMANYPRTEKPQPGAHGRFPKNLIGMTSTTRQLAPGRTPAAGAR